MSAVVIPSDQIFDMVPESSASPLLRRGNLAALCLSLAAHVAVAGGLSLVTFSSTDQIHAVITSYLDQTEAEPEQFQFEAVPESVVGQGADVNSFAASQAVAQQLGNDPQKEMEQALQSEILPPDVIIRELLPEPPKAELLAAVSTTGTSERVGGVEGAVDRLTFEIASRLRNERLVVNWIFDVSPSLAPRRKAIAERVETIYQQLNSMEVTGDQALQSTVSVFSEKTSILTPEPLDNVDDVVRAVRGIKSQEGGHENVFGAVSAVTEKFLAHRTKQKRGMIHVIVTDEAGDDPQKLEAALAQVRKYSISCFVVGDAAPFGRRNVETAFTLESGETVIGIMQRGPETLFAERISNIGFWGFSAPRLEKMSSGFGPYALTRLCVESGGMFLIASDEGGIRFNPDVMRNYAPDYRPIKNIETDLKQNRAKAVLIELAEEARREDLKFPDPETFFRAENDQTLRRGITDAQKPLADIDYKLERILTRLEQGEKDRAKVKEPRLQAAYDLELGRLSAMRARAFGYNAMLAEMKSSPRKFEKNNSNAWRLVRSKEISSGSGTKKLANRGSELLKRVIDEHPGTPWAEFAATELNTPVGWEWREEHYEAPKPAAQNQPNQPLRPKFIDEKDPKTGRTMRREVPAAPVRREI